MENLTIDCLLSSYEEAKRENAINAMALFIAMPTGEIETIINPNVEDKIAYVKKTYNENLVHSNCDKIQIIGFGYAEKAEDIFAALNYNIDAEDIDDEKEVEEYEGEVSNVFLYFAEDIDIKNSYPVLK